jgi:hypothetical protein
MTCLARAIVVIAALLTAWSGNVNAQPKTGAAPPPTKGAARQRPAPPAATPAPPPSDIRVRSYLTQTAAWVGDPVSFVIEIDAAPGIELVTSDLLPEKLVVEGLELGAADTATTERADGWRTFRYAYRTTPWDTAPPKQVGPLTLRFRRPVTASTASGASAANEIEVPGATLSMRSTLPDDGIADGARDRAASYLMPPWLGWFRPIGLGLVALGIAPVVLWLAARVRQPRQRVPRASSRTLQARVAAMFRELAIIDTSSGDGCRRAYDRLDGDLRTYVAEATRVPAAALSAGELRTRLGNAARVPVAEVCDALAECERARYGPGQREIDAQALRATIDRLQ